MNFKPTTGSYLDDRYPFILQVEESGNPHLTPYNDGIGWVTVGVGFNLSDDNVRNQVLAKMNITDAALIQKLSDYLEKQYDGIHAEKDTSGSDPINLTLLIYLIFLSLWLVACAPAISTAKPTPVLVLSSSGRTMDGPYPTYKFEIYEDGFVHYHGDINVKTIGDRQAKITPEQVQQLIATYRKIDSFFKAYEHDCGQKLTFYHGHYAIQLQYQGESSQLGVGGFANIVLIKLNKMTPIESWVCFPENDPLTQIHGDCPLRRLPQAPID